MIDINQVKVDKVKKPRPRLKLVLFLIASIFIIASALTTFLLINNKSNKLTLNNAPCSIAQEGSILNYAKGTFSTPISANADGDSRSSKVLSLENRILEQKKYLNDANCLHILAMVAIEKSDAKNANNYVNLLVEKIKESNKAYVLGDDPQFYTIEQMKNSINIINKNSDQMEVIFSEGN